MDKDEEKRLMQVIAAEVRAARGRAGLSRSEAARRSGISLSSLNRWERAERPIPVPELFDLCAVLGTTPQQIMSAAQRAFYGN